MEHHVGRHVPARPASCPAIGIKPDAAVGLGTSCDPSETLGQA